jgi:hypothetical protein
MNRIELTALLGSTPLGALASFGLLRVLAHEDDATRLHFVERDDFVAVLDTKFGSVDEIAAHLTAWVAARDIRSLGFADDEDVRIAPTTYNAMLRDAVGGTSVEALERASFLAALAADGAEDNSKHLVKPSPFYMASGQQSFLDAMRKIQRRLTADAWHEALLGPWRYSTEEWGGGWDPATERMHALRHKAPTKEKTACVAGAVRLAFEALPLFPTVSKQGRETTVGWLTRDRLRHWRWCLPSVPVGIETLRVVLASRDLAGLSSRKLREGMGAVYEATRHEFGQGSAVFRPARRLA